MSDSERGLSFHYSNHHRSKLYTDLITILIFFPAVEKKRARRRSVDARKNESKTDIARGITENERGMMREVSQSIGASLL